MKKRLSFRIGIFLVVLSLSPLLNVRPANGQTSKYRFKHLTIDNGLSQNLVYCVIQDHQGFMWFGTKDGLNRFDGYTFKNYYHDPFDTTSLSDNTVTALFSDSKGRLWVGTAQGGLNILDSVHNRFYHFLTSKSQTNNATGDHISSITEDSTGNLWVGTYGNGLYKFTFSNKEGKYEPTKITHFFHHPGDTTSINGNFIISVFVGDRGRLWISNTASTVQYANLYRKDVRFLTPRFTVVEPQRKVTALDIHYDRNRIRILKNNILTNGGSSFYEDDEHCLWIGAPSGLYVLDASRKKLTFFNLRVPDNIPHGNVFSISEGAATPGKPTHTLWLGMNTGVGIFNTRTYSFHLTKHIPGNNESLQPGRIISTYKDKSGCVWAGSSGQGLSKFSVKSSLFEVPTYYSINNSVTSDKISVRSFCETKKALFIGANDGLWMLKKDDRLFVDLGKKLSRLLHDDVGEVFNIIPADTNAIWIGCNLGLLHYNPFKNKVKAFLPGLSDKNQPSERPDNRIYKMYKGGKNIWTLTGHSFSVFDTKTKTFTNYYFNNKPINAYGESTYGDIYRNGNGNFWLGTTEGLLFFDVHKKTFVHYTNTPSDTASVSFNVVRCVVPDPKHPDQYLWIGTGGGGLNKFDLKTKTFTHFTVKDGLPNDVIYGILPDDRGNLWISTNKGLSRFNPVTEKFHNYDVNSGLQSNEFNSGAFYKNKQGKLFFGGIKGFNAFYPEDITDDPYVPPVVFTDFRLFNKSVSVSDKGSPLKGSITEIRQLTLPYKDNIISFQVAALDYLDPANNHYAYKLINFNNNWLTLGKNRLITFSNLGPGRYELHVKASNSDGTWNEKGTSLALIITPPWWMTWWAYISYALLAISVILLVRRREMKRIKLKNSLEIKQLEASKLKELDHLKSRFFANISHEFRTPLTLIMGPLEDLLGDGNVENFKKIVPDMHRSSKRLLQLINQLLDLSRLDAGNYRVDTVRGDIIPFIKQIVHSFSSLAHKRNIELETEVDPRLRENLENQKLWFYFDDDIIEKILTNLLSNAFKFTPDGGSIIVSICMSDLEEVSFELKVKDSGKGVPQEKLSYIFDRFYQTDSSNSRQQEGSGIGLALVKELVELHEGRISVSSEIDKGTTFCCHFPFNNKIVSKIHESENKPERIDRETIVPEKSLTTTNDQTGDGKYKPIVLIVEDQIDVRKYIRQKIEDTYAIIEGKDGRDGLEKAMEHIPDLVISDVMMPKMDGYEFCKTLKTDERTCHIPVIMLTARAEDKDRITGLETGADAYLIKPFNARELRLRVNNLIEVRNKMRVMFSDKLVVKPSQVTVTSRDSEFIQKLLSAVETHISDVKFTVEELADNMNMSISQLNRKLKAVINQSALQFIRSVRMQRALDLLKNGSDTIAEIAYRTGFEDPGYFTKVFKKHFGCLPSEKEKYPEG